MEIDYIKEKITIPERIDPIVLLGVRDRYLRIIEDKFSCQIVARDNTVDVSGAPSEVEAVVSVFSDLMTMAVRREEISQFTVEQLIDATIEGGSKPSQLQKDIILSHRGKTVRPKTDGQKRYVDEIAKHTVTFGIGPAGTGKTYLAMAMAVAALKRKEVSRIILTRPAVEAGESLGFLPGTMTEKIDPYLRPLYDALLDMIDVEKSAALIERGVIEIAPLAFMRGRTLNDSFVILDEAQNTTPRQMKMFLTRLGFNSRIVVTGDITQIDLPKGASGLRQVRDILSTIKDISFCELTGKDVVRHKLVQQIVEAYQIHEDGIEQLKLPLS